jgi:hypothetical protein
MFGLLVGGSFILSSILFDLSGKSNVLNPRLNNVISCLSIVGCFMGIKKYRDDRLDGLISYGRAFGAGMKILLLAAALYSFYTFALFSGTPELMEEYKSISNMILREVYGETSFHEAMAEVLDETLTPGLVAFGEFFRDILYGMFFLLVIAAILRRGLPPPPVNTNPTDRTT